MVEDQASMTTPTISSTKHQPETLVESILGVREQANFLGSLPVSPEDFFPEGKTPYDTQVSAMEAAASFLGNPNARLMVIRMPTAGGKSPLAAALTRSWVAEGGKSVIICPNKELQFQYGGDFGEDELSVVVGGVEFTCLNDKTRTCSHPKSRSGCSARDADESGFHECPYKQQIADAAAAAQSTPFCFTPHSFMAFKRNRNVGRTLPRGNGLIVVDEAHMLPEILKDFCSVSIDLELIERHLEFPVGAGLFAKEFFAGSTLSPNADGLPVAVVRPGQAVYLEALAEEMERKADKLKDAIKDFDVGRIREILVDELDSNDPDKVAGFAENFIEASERVTRLTRSMGETKWIAEISAPSPAADSKNDREGGDDKNSPSTSASSAFSHSASSSPASSTASSPSKATAVKFKLLLRPISIPGSFLGFFFSGFSKIILMSGSIFPKHMETLGLKSPEDSTGRSTNTWGEATVFEVGSRIDAERRRLYIDVVNGMPVNRHNQETAFARFAKFIVGRVVPRVPSTKGMVHVSSNSQAESLAQKLNLEAARWAKDHGSRKPAVFITPKKLGWRQTFADFKAAKVKPGGPSLILVAARRFEGIDLRDDLARLNIIAKVPYPNLADSMVGAMDIVYPGHKDMTTVTAIMQAMARGVRHPRDHALNICLDTAADGLLRRLWGELPEYTKDAIFKPETVDWIDHWEPPTDKVEGGEEAEPDTSEVILAEDF
jgi:Rad3-related DNA helicase